MPGTGPFLGGVRTGCDQIDPSKPPGPLIGEEKEMEEEKRGGKGKAFGGEYSVYGRISGESNQGIASEEAG